MRPFAAVVITLLVAGAVALAGCFFGNGNDNDGRGKSPAYEGQFYEYDLHLNELRTVSGQQAGTLAGGWQLYRGTHVDAWAFSLDTQSQAAATVPGPVIRVREGDTVRINFWSIAAPMSHTIHWHGIHLPWGMDGVPYVSQLPIGKADMGGVGPSFTYEFTLKQSGTYWYHCHVDTAHHLDMGMYGAFIVDPADPKDDPRYDQEAILMLDEWDKSHAHQNTDAIVAAMSKSGDPTVTANDVYASIRDYLIMNNYYNEVTGNDQVANSPGFREERDWYPVTYPPYFADYDTFLINGKAFPDTEPILVKTGQILRLRIINAGSELHALHLHGHHMYVTHKDGYRVPTLASHENPYEVDTADEFNRTTQGHVTISIAPGEQYDAYVLLDNPGPWMIHDHMPLSEYNDYISPGGMMTTLCYTDGWEHAAMCRDDHLGLHTGEHLKSGDILESTYNVLRQDYAVEQVRQGGSSSSGTKLPPLGHH